MDDRTKLRYAYAIIGALVIAVIALIVFFVLGSKTEGFNDRSEYGYHYDVINRRFASRVRDRPIAVGALQKKLGRMGQQYTMQQLNMLSDSIIINVLESEDDSFQKGTIAKIPLITDPRYKSVLAAIDTATRSGYRLRNGEERETIYGMLLTYFSALGDPLTMRLRDFSDEFLIRTFRTLKHPKYEDAKSKWAANPTISTERTSRQDEIDLLRKILGF